MHNITILSRSRGRILRSTREILGRRCDNPDLAQFGFNDNTIRIQRNVSYTSGNTRGKYDNKRSLEEISNKVVPKRNLKKIVQL